MFELIGVRYGSILDLPNLEIREKQVTSLTGPSGSGKTSVLRIRWPRSPSLSSWWYLQFTPF